MHIIYSIDIIDLLSYAYIIYNVHARIILHNDNRCINCTFCTKVHDHFQWESYILHYVKIYTYI